MGGGRGEIGVSVRRWAVFRWEVVPEMAGMWPNRGIWGGRIIGWERSFPGRGAKRFLEAAARSSQDGGRLRVTRRRERRSGRRGGFLVAARGWIGRTAHDVTVLTLGQYLRPTPKHLPVVEFIHPDTCGSAASQTRLQTRGMESPVAVHASKSIIRAKTFSFARG
jgi:hypothetical protein